MRSPSMDNNGLKKGTWSPEEDQKLIEYIKRYGIWNWSLMPKFAGLSRNGKSCRLRWLNYLNPELKRGNITKEEEDIIINLYARLGRRWSAIARRLPGRTDNEIKNYWHTHLKEYFNETLVPKGVDVHHVAVADEENSGESKIMTADKISSEGSINASSVDVNDVNGIGETSNDSLKLNGNLRSFWARPFSNGNLCMENEQESYIQGCYEEPSSPYGLYHSEYCFGHLHGEDIEDGTRILSLSEILN